MSAEIKIFSDQTKFNGNMKFIKKNYLNFRRNLSAVGANFPSATSI